MSDLYFNTAILLNGNSAPFTGTWVPMGRGRDNLFTLYTNHSGQISLQYKSPFFDEGVEFYNVTISGSGYASPTYSTSPMSEVRAVCSGGTGKFWAAITTQS